MDESMSVRVPGFSTLGISTFAQSWRTLMSKFPYFKSRPGGRIPPLSVVEPARPQTQALPHLDPLEQHFPASRDLRRVPAEASCTGKFQLAVSKQAWLTAGA